MKTILYLIPFIICSLSWSQTPITNTFPENGNVGIGTITPAHKLEVAGRVRAQKGLFDGAYGRLLEIGRIAPNGRRNIFFWVAHESVPGQGMVMTDDDGTPRLGITFNQTASNVQFKDITGYDYFEINDGTLGTDKVYMHLPKPDSRIVIGYNGAYLPEHKLVVKDGSAMFENGIFTNGNVGIGMTTPDAKLAVNGKIHAKEVKVDLIGWPDYVFANDYKLPTLEEVKKHIKEKGHLINTPSAEDVAENGVQLGEMNAKLLEKIEELTLYILQQEEQLVELKKEMQQLKKEFLTYDKTKKKQ